MRVVGSTLRAEVDLERGAKITSLRDEAGREWLAQGEGSRATPGSAFIDAEMAGWDECAPSIVSCRVQGRDIPDHGDLWDIPFAAGADGRSAWAIGPSLRYRFQRSIVPTETGLRLEYEAEALDGPIPFLWAAHPQFGAPPGSTVVLHTESSTVPVVDVMAPGHPETEIDPHVTLMDQLDPGGCSKLCVAPHAVVRGVSLHRPDGGTLTMEWSDATPYVGVWFDKQAYSREPVIAIEPTTGYFDSLATAVANDTALLLTPGLPRRWWVDLHAQEAGDSPRARRSRASSSPTPATTNTVTAVPTNSRVAPPAS